MAVSSRWKRWLLRVPGMRRLVQIIRLIQSAESRSIWRLQRDQAQQLLQPSATTKVDRHPALFAFAQQRLAGKVDARILSFGCSTGDEPLSLAGYLPDAIIDAVDINPRSIAIAIGKAAGQGINRINFQVGAYPPAVTEHYDAVFCLSVLRHGQLDSDQPERCSNIFPFSKYEAVVAALDRTIRPGGLLFIWGSNFHFADSAVAKRYRPLAIAGTRPHFGAFYGADDMLIESDKAEQFVFEKLL